MPKPKKGEDRSSYISRCVRTLKHEDPSRPTKECLGQCYGMWRQHAGGKAPKKK